VPRDRQLGEPFGDSTLDNRIADLHADVAWGAGTRFAVDATHLEATATSIKNVLSGNPLADPPRGTWARATSWEPGSTRSIDSAGASLTSVQTVGDTTHRVYFGLDRYQEPLDQPSLALPGSTSPGINVFDPLPGRVTGPLPGMALTPSRTTEDLRAVGASVQHEVDRGAWSMVLGVRFERQAFRYGSSSVLPVEESRWSPKFAVLHRVSDTDTVYANLSTGTSPNQVSSSSNRSVPSRRSAQAELGWKSLWRGGQLISELAVYRLDQRHLISADLGTLDNFDFTTAGSARSQGLEASLTGALTARWEVAATYAYTDARYLENAVHGGQRVPNVAQHVVGVWGRHRWSPAWTTGAGVSAQSRRFADEANTAVLPGYARVDLVQTWVRKLQDARSLELQGALRNLFDKRYDVSSHLHVSRWITPGQGLNAVLSATYRY